ncbi:hypothetical protein D5086_029153, partial [Populus alba]
QQGRRTWHSRCCIVGYATPIFTWSRMNGALLNTLLSLESCTTLSHLKIIHAHLIRAHTIFDVFAASCLISISIDKNLLDYAAQVFYQIQNPNIFIYNSFIRGFSGSKDPDKSFHFYVQSKRNGLVPDNLTYPFLVKACTQNGSLDMGIQAHGQIIRHGFDNDVYVQNSLVTMYSTLGDVTSARKLFDKMPEKNLVTWSVMISGYAKNSFFDKAIELYFLLQSEGVQANETVMVSVIASCAHLGALELGERAHDYILRNKMTVNLILGTALVDMYARCGSIDKAIWVFDQLPGRDALSWTTLIAGFAMHGYAKKALEYFSRMEKAGLTPREITFTAVLSACSHGGLVERGLKLFESMKRDYRIEP